MSYSNSIFYGVLRSIDSATFTGSYQNLGTAIGRSDCIVKIVNNSTVDVTISTDGGTNDQDFVPAGGFTLYDITTNKPSSTSILSFPKGTQFKVKGSAGTGLVYLVTLFVGGN